MSGTSTEIDANEFLTQRRPGRGSPRLDFLRNCPSRELVSEVRVCYPSTEVVQLDWQKFSSTAALAVSVTSFALSYSLSVKNASSAKNAITSVQPIWVFHDNRERGRSVRNVGNGPALDVLIARRTDDQSDWTHPVRMAPVSKDGRVRLEMVRTQQCTYSGCSLCGCPRRPIFQRLHGRPISGVRRESP